MWSLSFHLILEVWKATVKRNEYKWYLILLLFYNEYNIYVLQTTKWISHLNIMCHTYWHSLYWHWPILFRNLVYIQRNYWNGSFFANCSLYFMPNRCLLLFQQSVRIVQICARLKRGGAQHRRKHNGGSSSNSLEVSAINSFLTKNSKVSNELLTFMKHE